MAREVRLPLDLRLEAHVQARFAVTDLAVLREAPPLVVGLENSLAHVGEVFAVLRVESADAAHADAFARGEHAEWLGRGRVAGEQAFARRCELALEIQLDGRQRSALERAA